MSQDLEKNLSICLNLHVETSLVSLETLDGYRAPSENLSLGWGRAAGDEDQPLPSSLATPTPKTFLVFKRAKHVLAARA